MGPGLIPGNNSYLPDAKIGFSFLPESHYSRYIDLLRNEKPVFAYLNSEYPDINRLYTGTEPVGEEET